MRVHPPGCCWMTHDDIVLSDDNTDEEAAGTPSQVLPDYNNDVNTDTPTGVLLDDNNFDVDAGTPNVMLSDDNNDAGTHNDIVLFNVNTDEEAVGTPGEGQEETNEEASDLSLPNANTKALTSRVCHPSRLLD
eukprot:TCONS_00039598-protein